jgi:polyhydroxyalkanoate synthesis repressor PhaR
MDSNRRGEAMIRLIKRYESRKLYDTEESRYVSLEEIASWVRQGQEVKVVDNATGADVTSQTLTQIILDEGRRGTSFLPSELLHDLVRIGEKAMHTGIEQVQSGVDRLVQASIDRLAPVRRVREEMSSLRARLEQLEASLADLEHEPVRPEPASAEPVLVGPETAISRPFGREEKSE